jgi:hypothetical protein
MMTERPAADQPGTADRPTAAAQLKITAERMQGLTAVGTVPPADARYLITTFGITGSVAMSIGGADFVLRAAPAFAAHAAPNIALAALALGFAATILIAVCGRARRAPASVLPPAGYQPAPAGERRNGKARRT